MSHRNPQHSLLVSSCMANAAAARTSLMKGLVGAMMAYASVDAESADLDMWPRCRFLRRHLFQCVAVALTGSALVDRSSALHGAMHVRVELATQHGTKMATTSDLKDIITELGRAAQQLPHRDWNYLDSRLAAELIKKFRQYERPQSDAARHVAGRAPAILRRGHAVAAVAPMAALEEGRPEEEHNSVEERRDRINTRRLNCRKLQQKMRRLRRKKQVPHR